MSLWHLTLFAFGKTILCPLICQIINEIPVRVTTMHGLKEALENTPDQVRNCIPDRHTRPTRVISDFLNNLMDVSLACRMYPANYGGKL